VGNRTTCGEDVIEVGDKYEYGDEDDTFVIVQTGLYPRGTRWYRYQSQKYPGQGALIHEDDLNQKILLGILKSFPLTIKKYNRLESVE
jgi:hypothetical protein